MKVREIHYHDRVIPFEPLPGNVFKGRLLLDDDLRELIRAGTPEESCLDGHGRRLPGTVLFSRSPWSCAGPAGSVKLLCRYLNLHDGQVLFSTPDSYLEGGLFDWMRDESRA